MECEGLSFPHCRQCTPGQVTAYMTADKIHKNQRGTGAQKVGSASTEDLIKYGTHSFGYDHLKASMLNRALKVKIRFS